MRNVSYCPYFADDRMWNWKVPSPFCLFMFGFQLDYTKYFYIPMRKKLYRKMVKAHG